jgi:exopolyphosphatase/guanosine-5'-triphosphate,3'-diphosphate pyrophosphatase
MPGEDEARLTFLAVRRWFGWSSGRLGVFDIGGGSLEIAVGSDEEPDVAQTLSLGVGRLTREWLDAGRSHDELRRHVRSRIAEDAGAVLRGGAFDHAVATSKTFRSLARICGAAPSEEGQFVRRELTRVDLQGVIEQLVAMDVDELSELPGVSPDRAHQIPAGAVVAEATMDLFDLEVLEICPWALREGVLLQHLDHL